MHHRARSRGFTLVEVLVALALMAALAFVLRGSAASAQDSSLTVRIGLTYAAGTKPGVLVLPVNGGYKGSQVRDGVGVP